jgi:hypothetical protein
MYACSTNTKSFQGLHCHAECHRAVHELVKLLIACGCTDLLDMLGSSNDVRSYKQGEMEGRNVSILMPPPFSTHHNTWLRSFVGGGRAKLTSSSAACEVRAECAPATQQCFCKRFPCMHDVHQFGTLMCLVTLP